MKNNLFKRIFSVCLVAVLSVGLLPTEILAAEITAPDYLELNDGYLSVKVSKDNGGFLVDTVEGDKTLKSDDNKYLLYPDELYDTSYTTFRVVQEGVATDYIFGRSYGFLGIDSSNVTLTQPNDSAIQATWSVDGFNFTQTLTLQDQLGTEHGMVRITYAVTADAGTTADSISARVMLDTALGYSDTAIYQFINSDSTYTTVTTEQALDGEDYTGTFFAYDDATNPSVVAYTVNDGTAPTSVAVGHWNNLASSVYDFTPDDTLNFTTQYNMEYMTADSAVAMYYDMGAVSSTTTGYASTYYGVYSNITTSDEDKVSINVSYAPTAMVLNEAEDGYLADTASNEAGDYSVTLLVKNVTAETFSPTIAVYPEEGLTSRDLDGDLRSDVSWSSPYYQQISNLEPYEERAITFTFHAEPMVDSGYRKMTFTVYDTDSPSSLLMEDQCGERELYVNCPGSAGSTVVSFYSLTPESVYVSGSRNLYLSGQNFSALRDQTAYDIVLRPVSGGTDVRVADANVSIDTSDNSGIIVLDQTLKTGIWQVVVDWDDVTTPDTISSSLQFTVSDNPGLQDLKYGIVTIESDGTTAAGEKYKIGMYADEAAYAAAYSSATGTNGSNENVYLEIRGEFSAVYGEDGTENAGELLSLTATSIANADGTVSSTININDCLDIEAGTVIINIQRPTSGATDQIIDINIDGNVYTTGARTKIWSGVCAITSFENYSAYTMLQYTSTGEETTETENTIGLLWPGAASGWQTLAGMVLELRYCQFGFMSNSDETDESAEKVRIISFGAELDTSMLLPTALDALVDVAASPMEEAQISLAYSTYDADDLRAIEDTYRLSQTAWEDVAGASMALYAHDILFGGGFIGFNTSIELEIPAFADGFPSIEGALGLKVMNSEWAFSVEGAADFVVLEMEASFALISYNGIPVPDTMYFYIGGFTPGLNVEGMGIFWIQGLGGGVDQIYETFFVPSGVPPLTLLFSGQFAIFGVMSARADLSLSAQRISVAMSDISISNIDILDLMSFELQWYPTMYMAGTVETSMFDIISASGILMAEEMDTYNYFQGVLSGKISVPDNILLFGGYTAGSVEMGFDIDRLWGSIYVLGGYAGVSYYWGESVEFGLGIYDTPEAATSGMAIAYDEVNDRTLYMSVNYMDDPSATLVSTGDNLTHTLTRPEGIAEDSFVSLTYSAVDYAAALAYRNYITVSDYTLNWLDSTKDLDDPTNANANAMMRYDASTQTAYVTISFTGGTTGTYTITCDTPSTAELYGFAVQPELTDISYTDNKATVTGDLVNFDGLVIYAEDADGNVYTLYSTDIPTDASAGVTLDIPVTMPTGTYTLTAVAYNDTTVPRVSLENWSYTNPNQPAAVTSATAALGGDYSIDVTVPAATTTTYDGYRVTIYNADGTPTVLSGLDISAENGALPTTLTVGGQYSTTIYELEDGTIVTADTDGAVARTVIFGLEAGNDYTVGVTGYKYVTDGAYSVEVYSAETKTSAITMVAPVDVNIELSITDAVQQPVSSTANLAIQGYDTIDAVGSSTVTVNVSGVDKNGTYSLDGSDYTAFSGSTITLIDVDNGTHTLTVRGENTAGDGGEEKYLFVVDTVGPTLMLSEDGGGFFDGTSVTLSGISEINATLHVTVEGVTQEITPTWDGNRFSVTISLDDSWAYQTINLWAEDTVGNQSTTAILTLTNRLICDEDATTVLYLGDQDITGQTLSNVSGQLKLGVDVNGKVVFFNTSNSAGHRIEYSEQIIRGSASVSDAGVLTLSDDSYGMVSASLEQMSAYATFGADLLTNTITFAADQSYSFTISQAITFNATADYGTVTYTYAQDTTGDSIPLVFTDVVPSSAGLYIVCATVTESSTYEGVVAYQSFTITESTSSGGSTPSTYSNGVTQAENGTITLSPTKAQSGTTITITATPDEGYQVGSITVTYASGREVTVTDNGDGTYQFVQPGAAVYIAATFVEEGTGTTQESTDISFSDVVDGAYYYDAVQWAVENGVTSGYDDGTFKPNDSATRAQTVTFLWRAAGEPSATADTVVAAFTDVVTGTYYYDAMVWAVENGITTGTTETSFAPSNTATRGQIVTFLWRLAGCPVVEGEAISDVDENSYCYNAVLWAVSEGITTGYADGTFKPNDLCTRGQIVTFLYRYLG
ncbi:S-layer homology domain-containing protein [Bengtsoniella intestinalis]|uniref:S-layer homology domain-containing protein n=1 Tax=Bengtsoniella intestinalis TaxID=3073143 RepID=UPI00391F6E96